MDREIATVGGGCFWCNEAGYQRLPGVVAVQSGYAGGQTADPTYRQVCSGATGHAEVVQVTFDPSVVSYAEILQRFFASHDPTTMNRQGADVGTQYRSIILYQNEAQREIAEAAVKAAAADFARPIVTEIAPLEIFYPAEEYHQNYFNRNPYAGYCAAVIRPKLKKLGLQT